jgi:hypothetical protein
MVAFLGGVIVLLMFLLLGAWATIAARDERIAELEAVHAPSTSPPVAVRGRRHDASFDDGPALPRLNDLVGNDEQTQVCRRA